MATARCGCPPPSGGPSCGACVGLCHGAVRPRSLPRSCPGRSVAPPRRCCWGGRVGGKSCAALTRRRGAGVSEEGDAHRRAGAATGAGLGRSVDVGSSCARVLRARRRRGGWGLARGRAVGPAAGKQRGGVASSRVRPARGCAGGLLPGREGWPALRGLCWASGTAQSWSWARCRAAPRGLCLSLARPRAALGVRTGADILCAGPLADSMQTGCREGGADTAVGGSSAPFLPLGGCGWGEVAHRAPLSLASEGWRVLISCCSPWDL